MIVHTVIKVSKLKPHRWVRYLALELDFVADFIFSFHLGKYSFLAFLLPEYDTAGSNIDYQGYKEQDNPNREEYMIMNATIGYFSHFRSNCCRHRTGR
jgi:hypothetical protein